MKSDKYNIFFIFNLSTKAPNGIPRTRNGRIVKEDIKDKYKTELLNPNI